MLMRIRVECENAIRNAFPNVRILRSDEQVGPGGGRNKLVDAARFEFVASFDDDSYPIDSDYFERAVKLFEQFPDASVICAGVSITPANRSDWTSGARNGPLISQAVPAFTGDRLSSMRVDTCRCRWLMEWRRWTLRSAFTRAAARF